MRFRKLVCRDELLKVARAPKVAGRPPKLSHVLEAWRAESRVSTEGARTVWLSNQRFEAAYMSFIRRPHVGMRHTRLKA